MNILGLSCHYHDAAACVLKDGVVAAAAQEERFDRCKGSSAFPKHAVNACLQAAGLTIMDVDYAAFYEQPFLKFSRVLLDHVRSFPFSYPSFMREMPHWLGERLMLPILLKEELGFSKPCLFVKHHLSHAASAFLTSPFDQAAILTVDGVGETATTTWGAGQGPRIEIRQELSYPDSLGLLYTALTAYLGFAANREEGKVMALSDFGEPSLLGRLKEMVDVRPDGSFRLDHSYFGWSRGTSMCSQKFIAAFGPPRERGGPIEARHQDLAASLQALLEEILMNAARHIQKQTGLRDLCIGGGVGLNCAANDLLLREGPFDRIFVQPAAGDSGGALGAALQAHCGLLGGSRCFVMDHAYLGPEYTASQIRRVLRNAKAEAKELETPSLLAETAQRIAQGKVVGWFQGRMEFGPCALGHRSILADPRAPDMKDHLNAKVKHRESFRPYGASVLFEKLGDFFDRAQPSPFMLFASPVKADKRAVVPSAVHVDGTCRLQTVTAEANGIYYDLIRAFDELTGVPMVINTSFNDANEPIVLSPENAFACFARTKMDSLVMGNFLLDKPV